MLYVFSNMFRRLPSYQACSDVRRQSSHAGRLTLCPDLENEVRSIDAVMMMVMMMMTMIVLKVMMMTPTTAMTTRIIVVSR